MNSHPDGETLSAFLDGEAPEAEEHVRTCAECRERLDVLARVRTAVASPPPAYDTARKNAAIAAAVDAAAATPGTTSERRSLWRLVAAVGVAAAVVGHTGGRVRVRPGGRSGESSRSAGSAAGIRPGSVGLSPARLPGLRALTAAPPAASARAAQPKPGMSEGTLARGPTDALMA